MRGKTLKNCDEWGRVLRRWMTRHKSFGSWCNPFFPPTAMTWSSGHLHPILSTPKLSQTNFACLVQPFCGQTTL